MYQIVRRVSDAGYDGHGSSRMLDTGCQCSDELSERPVCLTRLEMTGGATDPPHNQCMPSSVRAPKRAGPSGCVIASPRLATGALQ